MKALIFGANGQDGHYLNALCHAQGVEAVGVSRSGNWLQADVASWEQVEALVAQHTPDYIFHLAANSTTRHSALFDNHATICTGALNILEAVKRHCPAARVFLSGSGLQFHNNGNPISERDALEANSPYSLARIHSLYAARYWRSLGFKVYIGFLFHHDSPRRQEHHVSQMIAQAAKRISEGSPEILELGDVSVQKEWAFAGDVVEGMWTLVNQDAIFEATIGTGLAYSIEEWLQECFALVGKEWKDHVRLRDNFTPEYNRLVSEPSTIRSLGWEPRVSLSELARMMVLGEKA